jgi:hypothetical protein
MRVTAGDGNARLMLVHADGAGIRPAGIRGSGGDSSCVGAQ